MTTLLPSEVADSARWFIGLGFSLRILNMSISVVCDIHHIPYGPVLALSFAVICGYWVKSVFKIGFPFNISLPLVILNDGLVVLGYRL